MVLGGQQKILARAFGIVAFSSLVAVIANMVSPSGIPLIGTSHRLNQGVEEVSLERALVQFRGKQAVFVDSRDREEFKEGHIPGAISLPSMEFDQHGPLFMELVSLDTIIVTYCSGKGCDSSMELAELLLDSGYRKVKVFYGGWQQWKDAGYPIEKGFAHDDKR